MTSIELERRAEEDEAAREHELLLLREELTEFINGDQIRTDCDIPCADDCRRSCCRRMVE